MRALRPHAAVLAALLLGGCATSAIDGNYAELTRFGRENFGVDPHWLRSEADRAAMAERVDALLATPLSADDAVRLALGFSPASQVALAGAAAMSADATQSARLPNPVFAFERLLRSSGAERELEIGQALSVSLLDILLLPARTAQADLRQRQKRLQAAMDLVRKVTAAREAWIRAVAAARFSAYADELRSAAESGAELARRMEANGNFSRLQRAREQALYADVVARQIRARQDALAAREALVRELGLPPAQAARLSLPERLPELPAAARDEAAVGQSAFDGRLDIRLARADLDRAARELGLTRVTSVVNGLDVAALRNRETGTPAQRGFAVELPLPLFDLGDAARAGTHARYLAAFNRSVQTGIAADAELRERYHAYRSAHDLARHYRDEIVPLRQNITDEMVMRYNGMLSGVFDLLANAQAQVTAMMQALEAERDFWLADAALQAALLGAPIEPARPQASA
ncbi:TolC family protein, partial [Aromatoleum evansii]|uniref:TolC family protein n=1 Tax=Aromatoleum evansii TaxID=59406 RepID=UPI00145F8993